MKESTKKEKKRLIGWNIVFGVILFCFMASIGLFFAIKTLDYKFVWPFFLIGLILAILQGFLIKIY
tara:strand:- start:3086 stop:3283 length:198 start_codon:yes stop_codon:yes gene_type:complete